MWLSLLLMEQEAVLLFMHWFDTIASKCYRQFLFIVGRCHSVLVYNICSAVYTIDIALLSFLIPGDGDRGCEWGGASYGRGSAPQGVHIIQPPSPPTWHAGQGPHCPQDSHRIPHAQGKHRFYTHSFLAINSSHLQSKNTVSFSSLWAGSEPVIVYIIAYLGVLVLITCSDRSRWFFCCTILKIRCACYDLH